MQNTSSTIANLPPERITEIFLRLPVKSLLQYRSVSKYWLDLISSTGFIKSHLSLSTNNKENAHHRLVTRFSWPGYNSLTGCSIRSLLYDSVIETSDLNIPMKKHYQCFNILGSMNGLICLSCRVATEEDLFIWNPSIRKYRKLPDFGTRLRYNYHYYYGFMYDELHDDYKVVVILVNSRHVSSDRVEVNIYSLMSNSWRRVDSCPPTGVFLNDWGMFVNGKLHWASTTTGLEYKTKYIGWNIISIDLANEKWGKVEQPSYGEGDIALRLGVLGSDLSIFCNNEGKHISIWVMKEYGVKESWTKMFTINYNDYPYVYAIPYFMSNRGEILVGFARGLKIYNPKDDSFSPKVINFVGQNNEEIYVESLVSPFPPEGQTSDVTKAKKAQIKTIK